MPSLLLAPNADPSSLICDIEPLPEYIPVLEKLMLFEKLVIMKQKLPPAAIRIASAGEELGQRLTLFENAVDQNFLVNNKLIDALAVDGQLSIINAIAQLRTSFANGFERAGIMPTDIVVPEPNSSHFPEMNLCLSLDFQDLLFLPQRGIPLEELLEFKDKRSAEYDAFWDRLYELGSDPAILCRADASDVLKRKIMSSTEALAKVSEERWGRRVVKSFKLTFAFDAATAASAALAISTLTMTNSPPIALGLAGLAMVRASIDMRPSLPATNSKCAAMSYLYNTRNI